MGMRILRPDLHRGIPEKIEHIGVVLSDVPIIERVIRIAMQFAEVNLAVFKASLSLAELSGKGDSRWPGRKPGQIVSMTPRVKSSSISLSSLVEAMTATAPLPCGEFSRRSSRWMERVQLFRGIHHPFRYQTSHSCIRRSE